MRHQVFPYKETGVNIPVFLFTRAKGRKQICLVMFAIILFNIILIIGQCEQNPFRCLRALDHIKPARRFLRLESNSGSLFEILILCF